MYVSHPLIKENAVEDREYQRNIFRSCLTGNTLVVLPTGLGKTIVAILVIAEVILRKGGKILFMAPTKPLVEQHATTVRNLLKVEEKDVVIFTGEVAKKKRRESWKNAKIVVSTPQVIQNDILSGDIDPKEVNLMVFDEAHRAVGNYAYVYIAKEYMEKDDHLILAMTASPGSDEEKIMEVINNLNIENVEIRTDDDPDVKPYVKGFKMRAVELPMPEEVKKLHEKLKELYNETIDSLRKFGMFITIRKVTRSDLLREQKSVQEEINKGKSEYYQAAMLLNMAIKVDYAIEYLETQGFEACYTYLQKIIEEGNSRGGSKASRTLVRNSKFVEAVKLARGLERKREEIDNPKLNALSVIIRKKLAEKKDARIMVFTQYRNTSIFVEKMLNDIPAVKAVRFVGQADRGEDKGLRQKEQVKILEKFRKGEYNILVSTSVGEEGLDIPSMDLVVFYEPIPSAVRYIQRRGRTGRGKLGEVIILTTKGTRDVAYLWASRQREKKMKRELRWLRVLLQTKFQRKPQRKIFPDETPKEIKKIDEENEEKADEGEETGKRKKKGQLTLIEFEEEKKISVYVDTRELRSEVVKHLSQNFKIIAKQLSVGDYIVSDRIAVERKNTNDFLESIKDGRLFQQIKNLRDEYEKPILVIEGESLFTRNFREEAIYGAMASILSDFNVPVIFTRNPKETAKLISSLVKRENTQKRPVRLVTAKKSTSVGERQRMIIETLPNVSSRLSQRLLEHFGSVKNVIDAEVEDLIRVRGIGRRTAEEIYDLVNRKFQNSSRKTNKKE